MGLRATRAKVIRKGTFWLIFGHSFFHLLLQLVGKTRPVDNRRIPASFFKTHCQDPCLPQNARQSSTILPYARRSRLRSRNICCNQKRLGRSRTSFPRLPQREWGCWIRVQPRRTWRVSSRTKLPSTISSDPYDLGIIVSSVFVEGYRRGFTTVYKVPVDGSDGVEWVGYGCVTVEQTVERRRWGWRGYDQWFRGG